MSYLRHQRTVREQKCLAQHLDNRCPMFFCTESMVSRSLTPPDGLQRGMILSVPPPTCPMSCRARSSLGCTPRPSPTYPSSLLGMHALIKHAVSQFSPLHLTPCEEGEAVLSSPPAPVSIHRTRFFAPGVDAARDGGGSPVNSLLTAGLYVDRAGRVGKPKPPPRPPVSGAVVVRLASRLDRARARLTIILRAS